MDHPEKTDYRAFYEVIYPVEQPKKPFYGFQKKRKHHIFFNQRGENSVTTKGEFLITIDTVLMSIQKRAYYVSVPLENLQVNNTQR